MSHPAVEAAIGQLIRAGDERESVARPRRLSRVRRAIIGVLRRCAFFLLLGAAANVGIAYALGLFLDLSQGRVDSASSWTGRDQWTVTRWWRPGGAFYRSVREAGADWSPGQATGAPDTPGGGDQVTAWASQSADGQAEWLTLDYAAAVEPSAVRVFETCSGGAVAKVTVFDAAGGEVEAWSGADPSPRGARLATSEIPLKPVGFATRRVKLYIDSAAVQGWNEVDAVGLVDRGGRVQWATAAEASSTYAATRSAVPVNPAGVATLAPAWGGFEVRGDGLAAGRVRREEKAVEARGWPLLALWGRVSEPPTAQAAPPVPVGRPVPGGGAANVALFLSTSLALSGGGPSGGGPLPGQPPLLVHPIWPGFLVNSVLYATVLGLLYWSLTAPRRFVREVGRLRRGCCVACGYDLGFDFAPGCPECGWRRRNR